MQAIEEIKKEYEAAKLMLEILGIISNKMERGERVDMKHLKSVLDFLDGFVAQNFCNEKTSTDEESGRTGWRSISKECEHGRHLIRKMYLSISQYKRGADRAAQAFASSVKEYNTFLNDLIGGSQDKSFEGYKRKELPNQDELLNKLKGMYLVG